jgi:hypothetical protein
MTWETSGLQFFQEQAHAMFAMFYRPIFYPGQQCPEGLTGASGVPVGPLLRIAFSVNGACVQITGIRDPGESAQAEQNEIASQGAFGWRLPGYDSVEWRGMRIISPQKGVSPEQILKSILDEESAHASEEKGRK